MGKMGAALATRLAGFGHELTVWNRTAAKAQSAAPAGAKVAATPRELASSVDIIISILTNAAAIAARLFRKDGLATAAISRTNSSSR